MKRVFNFSAGPSMLPLEVLERAAAELVSYGNSGMSVMEMSHRSPVYEEIIKDAERLLREVMNIPDNYKVLFLQGGASTQFAAVPLNLMKKSRAADYIVSGQFSKKAYKEAQKYGHVRLVASSEDKNFSYVPKTERADFSEDADYVHICFNNTIYGTKFPYIPDTGEIPLVADMSSCILSEPVDVSKFGLIYAGAQKNMAPAGLTVVIVREDLLGDVCPETPTMLDYSVMAETLSPFAKKVFAVTPDNPRSLPSSKLAELYRGLGVPSESFDSVYGGFCAAYLDSKKNKIPLICLGSLYMYCEVAEAHEKITEKNKDNDEAQYVQS